MMHDEEAASPRWKLNPNNFGPNIKSIKFLWSGVKTRVGRVSGNNKKNFRPKVMAQSYTQHGPSAVSPLSELQKQVHRSKRFRQRDDELFKRWPIFRPANRHSTHKN